MRLRLPLALAAVLLLLSTACGGGGKTTPPAAGAAASSAGGSAAASSAVMAGSAKPACGWRSRAPGTYAHVIWIVLENHSYTSLIGASQQQRSPYLNSLARRCGLATSFFSTSHPSVPNYLAMVSGSTGGVRDDCSPTGCPQKSRTIFQEASSHGLSWRVYAESMPRPCSTANVGRYVARHNPPLYYPAIAGQCAKQDIPMGTPTRGALVRDLASGHLASFTLVIPNQCNNTHDCPIGSGDVWLSRVVPRIVASPAYRVGRTALLITWDEGEGGSAGLDCASTSDHSCHIATVVVSPSTKRGTRSATRFDHYSLLGTTERMLGLRRLLGHAADRRSRSMRAAFNL
ncbi:MAG: alkaline phosphatase family protein [Actinomycetes bacterium]